MGLTWVGERPSGVVTPFWPGGGGAGRAGTGGMGVLPLLPYGAGAERHQTRNIQFRSVM